MAIRHDYSETRASLLRAVEKLDRTKCAIGHTHLQPTGTPRDILAQIDNLDDMLAETAAELQAARFATTAASRRGLRVV